MRSLHRRNDAELVDSSGEQPGELHDDPPAGAARVAGAVVVVDVGVLEAAEERAALGGALEEGLPLQEGEDGDGVGTRLHLTVIEARLSNLEPGGQLHSDVEAQDQESGSDSSLTAGDPARNDASESTQ